MVKLRQRLVAAIDRLADCVENGHLLASMGGEDLLVAASEKIVDLENGVAAGKRAAQTCKELTQALRGIEEVLDLRRTPDPYPGKIGLPCRVEALVDAWADASMALVDLLANPDSQAARDHANAVLVASRFGVKAY